MFSSSILRLIITLAVVVVVVVVVVAAAAAAAAVAVIFMLSPPCAGGPHRDRPRRRRAWLGPCLAAAPPPGRGPRDPVKRIGGAPEAGRRCPAGPRRRTRSHSHPESRSGVAIGPTVSGPGRTTMLYRTCRRCRRRCGRGRRRRRGGLVGTRETTTTIQRLRLPGYALLARVLATAY